jgi:hypothetical protein
MIGPIIDNCHVDTLSVVRSRKHHTISFFRYLLLDALPVFFIIPKGVEHLPIAEDEVHVLLLEPKTTLNTGNVQNERTVAEIEWI